MTQTWSAAASIDATQHFTGERDFRELLFKNGLPWVIVMDGLLEQFSLWCSGLNEPRA